MKRICIFNIKGGVGKTTTSVNLAAGLARKGKNVLLLDMDAQGSISSCLNTNESIKDMYHLIAKGAELEECLTHMGENLDLVSSKETLNDIEYDLADKANKEFILNLKLEKLERYDYVIMDCPPHFGTMTKNALFFSDEIFIPVSTDVLGFKGLKKTLELIETINKDSNEIQLNVTRIIPTNFDRRLKLSKDILNRIQDEFYGTMSDPIRTNSKLKEAPNKKRSIFAYAKKSSGAKDYGKLVEEIIHTKSMNAEDQKAGEEAQTNTDYIEIKEAANEMEEAANEIINSD